MTHSLKSLLFGVVTCAGLAGAGYALALHPFSPAKDAVAYAVDRGCLTYLRDGGRVADYVARRSKPETLGSRPVRKIYGGGQVTVEDDGRGSCYVHVRRGDGARLRDAVLMQLAEAGLKLAPFGDYDAAARRRGWSVVQETYCFRMDDRVFLLLMSNSDGGARVPLEVTLMPDRDGTAADKGLCLEPV